MKLPLLASLLGVTAASFGVLLITRSELSPLPAAFSAVGLAATGLILPGALSSFVRAKVRSNK